MFRYHLILLFPFILSGQNKTIDSLNIELKKARHDTVKCNILYTLIESNPSESWIDLNEQLMRICSKNSQLKDISIRELFVYKFHLAYALNNKAYYYQEYKGLLPEALALYKQSLSIKESISDIDGALISLNNISVVFYSLGNIDSCVFYSNKAIQSSEKAGNFKQLGNSLNSLASIYLQTGKIKEAISLYERSIAAFGKTHENKLIATSYNNLGVVYKSQGNIPNAISYYEKAIKMREKTGDLDGLSQSFNSMATLYGDQGDTEKSLEYYRRSLDVLRKIGKVANASQILSSIGESHLKKGRTDSAMFYQRLAIKEAKASGTQAAILRSMYELAEVMSWEENSDSALYYYNESLRLSRITSDNAYLIKNLNRIGNLNFKSGRIKEARELCGEAYDKSVKTGFPNEIKSASLSLYRIHKQLNDHKQALRYYETFVLMKDSVNNEMNRKAAIRSQLKYEYEKQAAADSVAHAKETEIKNAELKKQEAEIKTKKNQQYALFGGLALVIVFAGFMFNRWKVTQKQKAIIEEQKTEVEEQKKLVEEKQKEILDSIHYAKRIQLAQIPSENRVETFLSRLKR